MREIKFRAKDSSAFENAGWVYGFFALRYAPYVNSQFTERIGTVERPFIIQTKDRVEPRWIPVYPKTVGQYTGLKDKNGREIYEGDIVLAQGFHPEYDKRHKCVMAWDAIDCRWRATMPMGVHTAVDWPLSTPNILEVIGNIHDNPELLKQ